MVTAVLYYQSQRRCTQRQLWILRKDREGCWDLSSTYPCQCSVTQMCHALQRRQGSRPGVCRLSSKNVGMGVSKITNFFPFLFFCYRAKHSIQSPEWKWSCICHFFFQLFPIDVVARLSLVARTWYTGGRNVKWSIPNSDRHSNCWGLKLEMQNNLIPSLF